VAAAVNYANNNTEFGVSINLECYDGKNNVSAKIYLDESKYLLYTKLG
jgi:hypothetical protein